MPGTRLPEEGVWVGVGWGAGVGVGLEKSPAALEMSHLATVPTHPGGAAGCVGVPGCSHPTEIFSPLSQGAKI